MPEQNPIPAFPKCDLIVATDVLEHLVEPERYVKAFDAALKSRGLLWTNLLRFNRNVDHISNNLCHLQGLLEGELGYGRLIKKHFYIKK